MNPVNKKLLSYETFERRRKFPRLKMNLPVTIIGPGENKFKGTLYDISPDSAQVHYKVSDYINLFPDNETNLMDLESLKCMLKFDLAYGKTVLHIKLRAYPAYLRIMHKETLASGMVFCQDDLVEIEKLNNFFQYQLEKLFSEQEQEKSRQTGETKIAEPQKPDRVLINKREPDYPGDEAIIPIELEKMIFTTRSSKEDLENFKQLLIHVMSSLKVIMEMMRHINEKISLIEHKISRKS